MGSQLESLVGSGAGAAAGAVGAALGRSMHLGGNEEDHLKLYYLFMLADGEITSQERERFEAIRKKMDVSEEDEQKIEEEYADIARKGFFSASKNKYSAVTVEISKVLEKDAGSWHSIKSNKSTQATILWTMINLGYADMEFSEPERKVIAYLAEEWEFPQETLDEMMDIGETMYELEDQKQWARGTDKPADVVEDYTATIDSRLKYLADSVELLISEAKQM